MTNEVFGYNYIEHNEAAKLPHQYVLNGPFYHGYAVWCIQYTTGKWGFHFASRNGLDPKFGNRLLDPRLDNCPPVIAFENKNDLIQWKLSVS